MSNVTYHMSCVKLHVSNVTCKTMAYAMVSISQEVMIASPPELLHCEPPPEPPEKAVGVWSEFMW